MCSGRAHARSLRRGFRWRARVRPWAFASDPGAWTGHVPGYPRLDRRPRPDMDDHRLAPLRALIVDDDAACARTVASMLLRASAGTVQLADSAEAAMAQLAGAEFDVIFCDLNMPGRDGVETLRMFAEHSVRCPIVLISGADSK